MSFSISGIHVPHMKNTANHVPERPAPPKNVVLPVVMHIGKGDSTIKARLDLLSEQREILLKQYKQLEETINRLNYKISKYQEALQTGKLNWD